MVKNQTNRTFLPSPSRGGVASRRIRSDSLPRRRVGEAAGQGWGWVAVRVGMSIGFLFSLLFTGCAQFTGSHIASKTAPVEKQAQKVEILLVASETAQSMSFPEVTLFDKENGIIDFGSFGTGMMGLTAEAKVGADNKNVEITVQRVKRGALTDAVDIPLPVEKIADEYAKEFEEKLQQKEAPPPKGIPPAAVPSRVETAPPPVSKGTPGEAPSTPEPLVAKTLPGIKVEPTAPAKPPVTYLVITKTANFRAEGDIKSKVLAILKKGEKVEKLDESGNWFKVKVSSGTTGWVSKSLVKETD